MVPQPAERAVAALRRGARAAAAWAPVQHHDQAERSKIAAALSQVFIQARGAALQTLHDPTCSCNPMLLRFPGTHM